MQVADEPLLMLAQQIAGERQDHHPQPGPKGREDGEQRQIHPRHPRGQRDVLTDDRQQAPHEGAHVPVPGEEDLRLLHGLRGHEKVLPIPQEEGPSEPNRHPIIEEGPQDAPGDARGDRLETTNYIYATSQFAQAALRDVTGNVDMDDLLAKREEISQQIKEIVDAETDKWGIDVENVKIQNIELPGDMKRAMAKQAEAERERRANIINADGEKAAAETLAQAAEILAKTPGAINLRTLNTLERISTEPSQKTMMLFPVELIDALRGGKK